MLKLIHMFTDGSCLGNPGPGGYSIILRYQVHEKILTEGFSYTTNNRMELMAVIVGLESLNQSCRINIITDSQYVKKGITSWISEWKKKEWKTSKKKYVKNQDLWLRLDIILKNHIVNWLWIKSHIGHAENDKCDKIARQSAKNPYMKDLYYEKIHKIYM